MYKLQLNANNGQLSVIQEFPCYLLVLLSTKAKGKAKGKRGGSIIYCFNILAYILLQYSGLYAASIVWLVIEFL